MWGPVVDRLPHVRAILVDLPGHGCSNGIPWLSLNDTAEKVVEVVDDCRRGDVHIVGLSLGAYVGMTMLAQRPNTYTSAMLSGMHAGAMPLRRLMKGLTIAIAPVATRPFFARKTARMHGSDAADVAGFVAEAARTRLAAFRQATLDVLDYSLPQNINRVTTRTLIAAGRREHQVILGSLSEIERRLPNGRALEVPNVGHGWAGQDPALFARVLSDHIADR
ncbi:MAG: alpha/beta hydrolase [Devosia sp.]